MCFTTSCNVNNANNFYDDYGYYQILYFYIYEYIFIFVISKLYIYNKYIKSIIY